MRLALIFINILLTSIVALCVNYWVHHPVEKDQAQKTLNTIKQLEADSKVVKKNNKPQTNIVEGENVTMDTKEVADTVHSLNIFDPDRAPVTVSENGSIYRRDLDKINVSLSLVGTYSVEGALGAIIIQKLQGNAQQVLRNVQQKEYEESVANSKRITNPSLDNSEAKQPTNTVSASNILRQHLKVGDVTVNGFTLIEVTRSTAKLQRRNETILLSLLSPTESRDAQTKKAAQPQNNNNKNNNKQQKK